MNALDLLTRPHALVGLGLAVGLVFAPAAVLAQDADGDDITRDLNSGPPVAIATPPAPEPEPEAEAEAAPETEPAVVVEAEAEPAEAPAEAAEPTAPPEPEPVALTVSERLVLPFRVAMPEGAGLYPGRSGPEFDIFSVRREGRGLLMIYVGPQSQFPIYSGQMIEAGGRASIVATENGVRHAVEHLFQRPTAPNEVHIWTMSLDGPDRALAERIAQTLDVR